MSHLAPTLSPLAPFLSRRTTMRAAANIPVELVLQGSAAPTLRARALDLGVSGLCVQTHTPIDINSVHAIRMELDGNALELRATPRWSAGLITGQGPLCGFSFESVDARTEAILWQFVQSAGREIALFLRGGGVLEHLGFEDAFELALCTRMREAQPGEIVYGADDDPAGSDSIYVLFQGSVCLEHRVQGSQPQRIADVKPGEIFGGLPIIAACEPLERAVALERSTFLEFARYNVEYLMAAKPPLALALMRATSFEWMRRLSHTLHRLAFRQDVEARGN